MPNRLAGETSPYLLQHADNPVDWYPWGEEAFRRARAEERPVLLSVGYSACHWCHVMERESFEDPTIAGLMNELFVNVKVDREERPDVDAVYMEAVQALTRRGGWPMTVWLTPEGRPFYAGTYFPARDHPGMPSFPRVMQAVAEAWRERREGVEEQAARLTSAVSRALPPSDELPGREALEQAYQALHRSFDPRYGGFGPAPKFPQASSLEFLLRINGEVWAPEAAPMLRTTLDAMARGGIYDHLGGGFARYAVDQSWLIPHFEKMLYDNAQLARLYLRAWQETGVPRWRRVAVETLEYLLRDLGHPAGGFFAAEDADSEGEEGRFYVWSHDEFMETAGADDGPVTAAHFGVTATGNFEGRNQLHEAASIDEVAAGRGAPVAEIEGAVARVTARLLEARDDRVRPALDHKVITSWNGLALRAFAEAGAVLAEPRYLEAARRNARFVLTHLRRADGRLLRSWSQGRADIPGFLDDYASYAVGLLALYGASGEVEWFREGGALIEQMVALFADPAGGFFSTGADAEELIIRPKDQMDNPLPSGNSLAAEALLMLSLYTGDAEMRRRAEGTIRAGGRLVDGYPAAVGHLLGVLHALHTGPKEVAVVGPEAAALGRVVWERFRPHVVLAVDPNGEGAAHVPLLEGRAKGTETLAYVCEQFACREPVSDPAALRAQL